jgi:hypothetical protein
MDFGNGLTPAHTRVCRVDRRPRNTARTAADHVTVLDAPLAQLPVDPRRTKPSAGTPVRGAPRLPHPLQHPGRALSRGPSVPRRPGPMALGTGASGGSPSSRGWDRGSGRRRGGRVHEPYGSVGGPPKSRGMARRELPPTGAPRRCTTSTAAATLPRKSHQPGDPGHRRHGGAVPGAGSVRTGDAAPECPGPLRELVWHGCPIALIPWQERHGYPCWKESWTVSALLSWAWVTARGLSHGLESYVYYFGIDIFGGTWRQDAVNKNAI